MSFNFKATIEQSDVTLRSVLFKDDSIVNREENNATNFMMGIKTEIAFVDADPFIDDDFDEAIDYADNSNASNQQNDSYNNNSYSSQDGADETGDPDSDDDASEENFEMKPPKDKAKKKPNEQSTTVNEQRGESWRVTENVDYVKDEDGKFVCQICNKKLVDKKGLTLHVRLHTGENLKRCNICNRGEFVFQVFPTKSSAIGYF